MFWASIWHLDPEIRMRESREIYDCNYWEGELRVNTVNPVWHTVPFRYIRTAQLAEFFTAKLGYQHPTRSRESKRVFDKLWGKLLGASWTSTTWMRRQRFSETERSGTWTRTSKAISTCWAPASTANSHLVPKARMLDGSSFIRLPIRRNGRHPCR